MEDNGAAINVVMALVTALNTLGMLYMAFLRNKPEIKKTLADGEKTEAEVDSEIVSAANQNLEGAEISSKMLMQRIQELRSDLDSEKKARRDDADYFRRRFRDAEREARDYRQWAARLAKQVIEAGKIPIPFVPSMDNDSERGIKAIERDEKEERIEERRIEDTKRTGIG